MGGQPGGKPAPYWGVIPTDRPNAQDYTTSYVRARVTPAMVVDVEVTKGTNGFTLGPIRIASHEEGTYRPQIRPVLAVLPDGGNAN